MKVLNEFTILVRGLDEGIHNMHFQVEKSFFEAFENTLFESGKFSVEVEFDKRSNMFVLNFDIKGFVETSCDRCTANIQLPVTGDFYTIFKLTEDEGNNEAEVVFLEPSIDTLNIAKYIYEFILLSIPLVRTYNCEDEKVKPCDEKALEALESMENTKEKKTTNPVWDNLKGLLES